ncbi:MULTISPECIES: hypothetical protein [Acinetobacter]|uniref:hypothetical protein n=1 Tax=Acinetobacter TaxID=469 RepID=UPI000CEC4452|nr:MULTISPECIES: hypothetical protein [Acinetobacter]MCP0915872.1 hypothetical protein [Acinetobacter indicus]MCP0918999.1 hypothetical protein [Acinetobacter indicus]MCP0921665.1 hypothetical protein [Acinetobacter indicus]MDM1492191.1 hypothetical protein [Acinetobacter indicus]MDV4312910.1 hypothetical protein [Acinetobacter indicus]
MKKLAFVSLVAVALTGCVVTPYENGPRHSVYTGYDRGYSNYPYTVSRWENERRPVYIQQRPSVKPVNRPHAQRPHGQKPGQANRPAHKPTQSKPAQSKPVKPNRPVANKPPAKKPQASNPAKAKPVTALPPTSGVQRPLRPGV